ncbi:MAG: nucleoside hydrolase [Actinobacteria bacterium]|nr:nucleoside hydrolase [Actinomycetota bacterium]
MSASKKRVVMDFDNTMGIPGCDVDDGLALLYLVGNPEHAIIEAACSTYGNNRLDVVHANTEVLLDELGLDIPLYRGGQDPAHPISEAAEFLCDIVDRNPGEISILATGSLTNLRGASLLDDDFFSKVREISLMGGITQSLAFNGKIMDELNFACDPQATYAVLNSACKVATATANNCLPAFFTLEGFKKHFYREVEQNGGFMYDICRYWFRDMEERYRLDGFCCWDVVSAAYLIEPELFDDAMDTFTLSEAAFSIGYLERAFEGVPQATVHTPVIRDAQQFVDAMYASWQRAIDLLGCSGFRGPGLSRMHYR